jgi:2-iminobutanoate/2-iminopropanoate deaminase
MGTLMRIEIRATGVNEPIGHYSDAVRFGDLLFISGIGPLNEKREVVGGGDAAAQARQVFANMARVLALSGLEFRSILKITVFVTDANDYGKVDQVRREIFGTTRPASSAVGVKDLMVPGMKVEIEAVAGFET